MISSILMCAAIMNPGNTLHDLSIALEPSTRQEIMSYAYAGALQSAAGVAHKNRFRGPAQAFYSPDVFFLQLAQEHLQMPVADREKNYDLIRADLANTIRTRNFRGFTSTPSINGNLKARSLTADLRNSLENQYTFSAEIAELFFSKLLSNHTPIGSRLRVTYVANGQVAQRDVSYMGPFSGMNSSLQIPKFEFLPVSSGPNAKSPFILSAEMILNIQKI